MRGSKRLEVLLLGCVSLSVTPMVTAGWLPPDLRNTRIRASVEYLHQAKLYRYEYEIEHPETNRGRLRSFSLATDIPFPYGKHINKDLLAQSGVKVSENRECDSPLDSGVGSVVCVDPAPDWGIASLKKGVIWSAIPAWGEPVAKTSAGRVISGFTIYTRVPPGAVMATLSPVVDTGPDSPYQIYGERCEEEEGLCPDLRSFDLKYSTIGPIVPKE